MGQAFSPYSLFSKYSIYLEYVATMPIFFAQCIIYIFNNLLGISCLSADGIATKLNEDGANTKRMWTNTDMQFGPTQTRAADLRHLFRVQQRRLAAYCHLI